ncbi:hypothetical protein Fmac_029713 [Flemingia macrophylla]|uniref:Transposase putative helix-turn-helix domain-containing protein n=1 Tax=Flemingia macrophylla TaxID=520843 RepID=A0ABD1LB43_9FABA
MKGKEKILLIKINMDVKSRLRHERRLQTIFDMQGFHRYGLNFVIILIVDYICI